MSQNKSYLFSETFLYQVSRAAESTTTSLVLCMPSHLAIPQLNNLIKKEQFPDIMIAIKLLDRVLEVQKLEQVKVHLKEIMLGLLKVRKCFPLKCIIIIIIIPGLRQCRVKCA